MFSTHYKKTGGILFQIMHVLKVKTQIDYENIGKCNNLLDRKLNPLITIFQAGVMNILN